MPGATPLGLRYPYQNETVDAASWQNLANDIDALMTVTKTLRDKAYRRPTASITNAGSNSLPVNTATGVVGLMLFNRVQWDTDGLTNLGVNNDRINLTPGIWYCRGTIGNLTATTTTVATKIFVNDLANTTSYAAGQIDAFAGTNMGPLTVNGVLATAVPLSITLRVQWIGTGGPGAWVASTGAALQVMRIREFLDV